VTLMSRGTEKQGLAGWTSPVTSPIAHQTLLLTLMSLVGQPNRASAEQLYSRVLWFPVSQLQLSPHGPSHSKEFAALLVF